MRYALFFLSSALLAQMTPQTTTKYPAAHKGDVVDDYHGVKIADPYRWLEDTDSAATAEWVAAENRVTQAYLAGSPSAPASRSASPSLYDYERFSRFEQAGSRYLFFRNDGLQNQDVLYAADRLEDAGRVLLDPNTLRADGTAALSGVVASRDGKLLAYGLADAGSDWAEWHVRDIETGRDLPDTVRWVKFSPWPGRPARTPSTISAFPNPNPARPCAAPTPIRKSTCTAWAGRSRTTAWSMNVPTGPSGSGSPRFPTTGATC